MQEKIKTRKEAEAARSGYEAEISEKLRKQKEAEAIRKAEQASVTPDTTIEATNEYIATTWDKFNRTVDSFFTNTNSPKENKSSVFLSTSATKRESVKFDTDVDFQLKFDLPNTTKNLKIIIEKQTDEIGDALSDNSVSRTQTVIKNGRRVSQKDSHYTAGASIFLRQSKEYTSLIKFGVRIDMPLNPSLKMDLSKEIKGNIANINLLQKFLYYRQEGFQEISQIAFTRKLSEKFQLDQVNSLVWADKGEDVVDDDFLLRHSLILTQNIGDEKFITYSIGANARLSPAYFYENYDTSVSYSQRLYQDWLYTAFTVGADFPKQRDFTDNKFVQIKFDIFFREKN